MLIQMKWIDRNYAVNAHLPNGGVSSLAAVVAVGGRRRGSWRRFVTPDSLLKDALDLFSLWLFEKLCFVDCDLNIFAGSSLSQLSSAGQEYYYCRPYLRAIVKSPECVVFTDVRAGGREIN